MPKLFPACLDVEHQRARDEALQADRAERAAAQQRQRDAASAHVDVVAGHLAAHATEPFSQRLVLWALAEVSDDFARRHPLEDGQSDLDIWSVIERMTDEQVTAELAHVAAAALFHWDGHDAVVRAASAAIPELRERPEAA